eukprot:s1191_g11.t1
MQDGIILCSSTSDSCVLNSFTLSFGRVLRLEAHQRTIILNSIQDLLSEYLAAVLAPLCASAGGLQYGDLVPLMERYFSESPPVIWKRRRKGVHRDVQDSRQVPNQIRQSNAAALQGWEEPMSPCAKIIRGRMRGPRLFSCERCSENKVPLQRRLF